MARYQIIALKDNTVLKESDSYSFILWVSKRHKKSETDFKIIDSYTGSVKETFEGVIL